MIETSATHGAPRPPRLPRRAHTGLLALLGLGLALAAAPLAGCSSCSSTPEEPAASSGEAAAGGIPRRLPAEVTLLAPTGGVSAAQPFTFRWQGPEEKRVTGWTLTVMARPDVPLWTSPEQPETELEAPRELLNRLEPGQVYTWRVMGRLEGGGRVRSEPQRLVITAGS